MRGDNERTWTPGFSVRVPAMKSASSGLIERSSMRTRRAGTMPWRGRNTLTRGGTSSGVGKFGGQNRGGTFCSKLKVQNEIGSQRFDEQLSGRVVDEERKVERFVCDFIPFHILAFALLPDSGVVEEARFARDRRGHGVRTG